LSLSIKIPVTICIVVALISWFAQDTRPVTPIKKPICGLTLVAPPRPFETDPMEGLNAIHCNWIAIVPYAFTPRGKAEVRHNSNHQWWGERPEGVQATIEKAKKAGLKTMLKPQVWSRGWWTGDFHFAKESEWQAWEEDYRDYILSYASLAESLQVDLLCLGTEFKNAIRQRPAYWEGLIDQIRKVYHGPLTYAANWDNFEEIPFWEKLDFIGINAYFPLSKDHLPSLPQLVRAWKRPVQKIRKCQRIYNKPVIFTEYGYLSVDGAAFNTWDLERKLDELAENQDAQAIAIDALHTVFSREDYWAGGFLWKWYPGMKGHEGYPEKDYTPQGKKAEKVLERWFSL
jgi:hypothetical protein